MTKNKNNPESTEKLELAKKIANRSKNVKSFYETVEEAIVKFFRWVSSIIDKIFFSKRYVGLFALLLACLAYFVINYDQGNIANTLTSSKTLSNVAMTVRYNSESFEVSGVPSSCEVIITGDAANVNNAATKNGSCRIDLEGYTEGTHVVKVVAVGYGDNVNTTATPGEAQVTLKKKTTMQFDLSYDYINQNKLNSKFILGIPTFSSGTKINIRASEDTLNSIALVKALIDVSGQVDNFEVEAPLVAYDKNGKVIDAEIVPSTVMASVTISSPSKKVPIKLKVSGELANNMAIDSVQMDHQSTEIYAPQSILDAVNDVTVNLDLSTLTTDADIQSPVILPSGVNGSDVTTVNLKIALVPESTKVIADVPISYHNNEKGFGFAGVDTTKVNVTVTGSPSFIDSLTANDFEVFVDLSGIEEPGTYNSELHFGQSLNSEADLTFVKMNIDRLDLNFTLISQE